MSKILYKNKTDKYHIVSSCLVIMLGLVVIYGWESGNIILVQILPEFVPMQYNTAIGFTLAGFIVLIVNRMPGLAILFGIILAVLAVLTLVQYITGINFGIDELFKKHYITVETSHPGRMAPNTAVCFLLSSLSVLFFSMAVITKNKFFNKVSFTCNLMIFAFVIVAIFGYFLGYPSAYGWGALTKMALHTAFGFVVLSLGLLKLFLNIAYNDADEFKNILPVTVFTSGLIASALMFNSLLANNNAFIQEQVKVEASYAKRLVDRVILQDVQYMNRLFSRSVSGAYKNYDYFERDINSYLEDISYLKLMSIYKGNKEIVYSKNKDIDTKLSLEGCKYKKLSSNLSENNNLSINVNGGNVCINDFALEYAAILDLHKMIAKIIYDELNLNYLVELHYDNKIEFLTYNYNKSDFVDLFAETIPMGVDKNVSLKFIPSADKVQSLNSVLPYLSLVFGFIVTLVLTNLVKQWINIVHVNKKLSGAVTQLENYKDLINETINISPQALIKTNKDGEIIFCNREANNLLRSESDLLVGERITDIISKKYLDMHSQILKKMYGQVKQSVKQQLKDVSIINTNYDEVPVDISVVKISRDKNSDLLYSIIDNRERKEFEHEILSQTMYLQLIYDVTNLASLSSDFSEILQSCLDLICHTLNWPIGHIYIMDKNKLQLLPSHIWYTKDLDKSLEFKNVTNKTCFNKGVGLPGRIWVSRKAEWIEDVNLDSNFPRAKLCKNIGVRGAVGFPIVLKNEVTLVFEFFSYKKQEYDSKLINVFSVMGEQISSALERQQAQQKIEAMEIRNRMLLSAAGEGIYGLDQEGKTTFVNPAAEKMLGFSQQELLGKKQHQIIHHSKADGSLYKQEECKIYNSLKDGKVHHVDTEVFWRKDGTSFPVAYISNPIIDKNNKVEGIVVTFNDITERKKNEESLKQYAEKLNEMAYFDYLTGAINRANLELVAKDTIARAKRYKRIFAILAVDLDNFKDVNDNLGHKYGDLLLVEVVKIIKNNTRENDVVARIGGDEFVVLCDEISDPKDAVNIGNKILSVFKQPIVVEKKEVNVTLSIGISVYPEHGLTLKDLMQLADKALYQAKGEGRDKLVVFGTSTRDS